MSDQTGPDPLSRAERSALASRARLRELLDSTCKHLHTPETCQWCAALRAAARARDGDYEGRDDLVVPQ